ncbi:hypothetical protein PF001_g695 [Phytophthora fragariae]|uniref:Uncharacterized protein n=1 Tax=Phytophthora fragariae TaxID=53985 RepID=A0A6A4EY26_9STRA|nr:hypothetical protein PF001_g695 [Phytophthora fragariae]
MQAKSCDQELKSIFSAYADRLCASRYAGRLADVQASPHRERQGQEQDREQQMKKQSRQGGDFSTFEASFCIGYVVDGVSFVLSFGGGSDSSVQLLDVFSRDVDVWVTAVMRLKVEDADSQRAYAELMVSACVGGGDRLATVDDLVYVCIVAMF